MQNAGNSISSGAEARATPVTGIPLTLLRLRSLQSGLLVPVMITATGEEKLIKNLRSLYLYY